MLNNDFSLNQSGVSNAYQTKEILRHRWYYYKEGFSPSLVESAIEDADLNKNDFVLDPFNGSGTVTLSSAMNGISSIGFEINPFTSFLANTKTLNLSKKSFKKTADKILVECLKGKSSYLENYSTFTKNDKKGKDKWLFNKEVLRTFNGGFAAIKESGAKSSNLIKLALISSAMQNCNARKDGKCLRYRDNWEKINYGAYSFINSLELETEKICNDLDFEIKSKPIIKTGDSRKLIKKLDRKFKLCVTSPPYLNTFDYTDIYRPELFLGGFIESASALKQLRYNTIRSHLQANWSKSNVLDFGGHFNDVFRRISEKKELLMHKNIPDMISAYFEDMEGIFIDLKEKAEKGASLWFVVSTSAYANEHIPVDLILADIGTKVGWKLKEIGVLREIQKRKTRFSPDIDKLRESVIILTN